MTWRTPAVLTVSLVLLGVLHFVILPGLSKPTVDTSQGQVLELHPEERLVRLEVSQPGKPDFVLERENRGDNYVYMIRRPIERLADRFMGDDVMYTLRRLDKPGRIPAQGKNLTTYGLDNPRLTLTVQTDRQKIRLKFGSENPFEEGGSRFVYYMVDGDNDWIYQIFKPYYDGFARSPAEWRARQVVDIPLELVRKIVLYKREPTQQEPATFEFEMKEVRPSSFDWVMNKPYVEELSMARINLFLTILSELRVLEYLPAQDLSKYELDVPHFRVKLELRGKIDAITISFGRIETEQPQKPEEQKKSKVYVLVGDSNEIAVCDAEKFVQELPKQPEQFRYPMVVRPRPNQFAALDIVCKGLGRLVLALEQVNEGGRQTLRWVVKDPPGVMVLDHSDLQQVQQGKIHEFVEFIRQAEIVGWGGRGLTLDRAKIEAPECKLTIHFKDGDPDVYYFETVGDHTHCYRPMGGDKFEWVTVPRLLIRALKKLDLNFQVRPPLQVKPDQIRIVRIQSAVPGAAFPVVEFFRQTEGQGAEAYEKWVCKETKQGWEFDDKRAAALAQVLSHIDAVDYESKNPDELNTFGLANPLFYVHITVDAELKVLAISDELGDGLFFAKFEDRPEIFRIDPQLVEMLRKGVHKRKFG